MRLYLLIMLLCAGSFSASVAHASAYPEVYVSEQRASLNLVLPLGGQPDKPDSKPRLQLSFDGDAQRARRLDQQRVLISRPRQLSTIGFTISSKPLLLLNNKTLPPQNKRANFSTLAWIGVGVAVTLVGGALVLQDALNDPHD